MRTLKRTVFIFLALFYSSHLWAQAQKYVPGELIIKMKPQGAKGSTKAFNNTQQKLGMKLVKLILAKSIRMR